MHPVNYLFEEIYREHWGIPADRREPARKHHNVPAWRRKWTAPRGENRR